MQWKSHRTGGFCAATLTTAALIGAPDSWNKIVATAAIVFAADVGSLLPDIDHPQSKISRNNKILSFAVSAGLAVTKFITSLLLLLCFWMPKGKKEQILKGFEHRGVFHTPLMVVLLFLLLGLVKWEFFRYIQYGLCAGYVSHILMDMLTVSGVKLLYPFVTYSFHLIPFLRLHTGQKGSERAARIIFIVLTIILAILLYPIFPK